MSLHYGVGYDCKDMEGDEAQDHVERDGMDVCYLAACFLGDAVRERTLKDAVVLAAKEARSDLGEENRQQGDDHPAPGGVVADLRVGFTPGEMGEVAETLDRISEKGAEAGGLAADEPPYDAEEQQGQNGVAREKVKLQPVFLDADVAECDEDDDGPVEETGRCVPDAHAKDRRSGFGGAYGKAGVRAARH